MLHFILHQHLCTLSPSCDTNMHAAAVVSVQSQAGRNMARVVRGPKSNNRFASNGTEDGSTVGHGNDSRGTSLQGLQQQRCWCLKFTTMHARLRKHKETETVSQRHCKGMGHGSHGSVRVTSVTTRQANKHRRKVDSRMDIKEMVAGEKDEKMRQHSQKEVTL